MRAPDACTCPSVERSIIGGHHFAEAQRHERVDRPSMRHVSAASFGHSVAHTFQFLSVPSLPPVIGLFACKRSIQFTSLACP